MQHSSLSPSKELTGEVDVLCAQQRVEQQQQQLVHQDWCSWRSGVTSTSSSRSTSRTCRQVLKVMIRAVYVRHVTYRLQKTKNRAASRCNHGVWSWCSRAQALQGLFTRAAVIHVSRKQEQEAIFNAMSRKSFASAVAHTSCRARQQV